SNTKMVNQYIWKIGGERSKLLTTFGSETRQLRL
ncbi:hypothetical protein EDD52_1584, partial [Primorskyibacter sedentarius]